MLLNQETYEPVLGESWGLHPPTPANFLKKVGSKTQIVRGFARLCCITQGGHVYIL